MIECVQEGKVGLKYTQFGHTSNMADSKFEKVFAFYIKQQDQVALGVEGLKTNRKCAVKVEIKR